jgi:hypothetical protein
MIQDRENIAPCTDCWKTVMTFRLHVPLQEINKPKLEKGVTPSAKGRSMSAQPILFSGVHPRPFEHQVIVHSSSSSSVVFRCFSFSSSTAFFHSSTVFTASRGSFLYLMRWF